MARSALFSLLLLAAPAAAQRIEIQWDAELAHDFDRANYDGRVRGLATGAWQRVSGALGLPHDRPLRLRVYTPAAYAARFGAKAQRERGAHYQGGAVHVNGGQRLDDHFAALLEHELVHAVVDGKKTGYRLPSWLNEGLAERFRWRRLGVKGLAQAQVLELQRAAAAGRLVPLPTRGSLSPYGYLQAFAAVCFIEETRGRDALLRLTRETLDRAEPFPKVALDVLGRTPAELEKAFAAWIQKR